MGENSTAIVETRSLGKRYGSYQALEDCSLSIESGEIFGLLGPNGAGKSTLLRLLMGFLRPTSGSASIQGLDCYHQRVAVKNLVAYLPGDARLFRAMRGRDVLRFFADIRPQADLNQSLKIAERLDLDLNRRVAFMSTGMRQKLAIAAVMSANTPLIILDEPTANLDPTVRSEVIEMVVEAKHAGRTVVFSSHVLSEVEESCDRVVILRSGKLVHSQTMSELRKFHRIHAKLDSTVPTIPQHLAGHLEILDRGSGAITIETDYDLAPLMQWVSNLPLEELKVEPIGLRAIYDRYHRFSSTNNLSDNELEKSASMEGVNGR